MPCNSAFSDLYNLQYEHVVPNLYDVSVKTIRKAFSRRFGVQTKMGSHWFSFKTSCESRTIMEQNKPNCAIKICAITYLIPPYIYSYSILSIAHNSYIYIIHILFFMISVLLFLSLCTGSLWHQNTFLVCANTAIKLWLLKKLWQF